MNLINAIKAEETGYTMNGGVMYKSTGSAWADLFALGGAMRDAEPTRIINLFAEAYAENRLMAMVCLFYLRDIEEGQGERRFFNICMHWLANSSEAETAKRVMKLIPYFGRFDDLYAFVGTPLEKDMFAYMKTIFDYDMANDNVSLLGKWLKSENASSAETKKLGKLTREYFNLSSKAYRKALTELRNKIDIVESKMSHQKWHEINYNTVPGVASLKYVNAFRKHDFDTYMQFIRDKNINKKTKTLYPSDIVHGVLNDCIERSWSGYSYKDNDTDEIYNTYWKNYLDQRKDINMNAIAVVDNSGSMIGKPMEVAISLGMYCASKLKGQFSNYYISFSRNPKLQFVDPNNSFAENVRKIYNDSICENTNIEKVFELILSTALKNRIDISEMPKTVFVISDMEFDHTNNCPNANAVMEHVKAKFDVSPYECPNLVFWNVDAKQNNIPMKAGDKVTFVSGYSPAILEAFMNGKTGFDMMKDKLSSGRYQCVVDAIK